jgi:hypothetical protein
LIELDTYFSGFFLVVGSSGLAVIGLLLVRRCLDSRTLIACHEVGGYLLSVVGTLYAVLLGLIVVEAMGRFQAARQTTDQEANALADIVLFSHGLPSSKRAEILRRSATYAELVLDKEWKAMDDGGFSPEARRAAVDLVRTVSDFEPTTEREKATFAVELQAAGELWNNRRVRIATSTHGIPALEWVVLIAGAIVTIIFTYFFMIERLAIQIAMTALVSMIISLNIYLVMMFGYPFSGDLTVGADSFRLAQTIMEDRVELTPVPNAIAP